MHEKMWMKEASGQRKGNRLNPCKRLEESDNVCKCVHAHQHLSSRNVSPDQFPELKLASLLGRMLAYSDPYKVQPTDLKPSLGTSSVLGNAL